MVATALYSVTMVFGRRPLSLIAGEPWTGVGTAMLFPWCLLSLHVVIRLPIIIIIIVVIIFIFLNTLGSKDPEG